MPASSGSFPQVRADGWGRLTETNRDHSETVTTPTYCTILSTNYLPRALALAESLHRHEQGATLRILFIDHASDDTLPDLPGVVSLSTSHLGLAPHEAAELATGYDLVEYATAVKPLLLKALLTESDQVVYLDPDTYVTATMVELSPALAASAGGILLTPHFLHPPSGEEFGDGHMLLVGVHNLGFCGVDRRASRFLDWWWGHLRTDCLYDPLAGLFVDQKWMDIGSSIFEGTAFRHAGYNVGVANLEERPVAQDEEGYLIASTGDRLRLFHFHAFDSSAPEKLTVRYRHTVDNELADDSVLLQLCKEYAGVLSGYEQRFPAPPPYPYETDTRGRRISRQLRRAYLRESRAGRVPPSPFDPSAAAAWDSWRKRSWRPIARGLLGETAKCLRIVLPEEYDTLKRRFPALAGRLNDRFSGGTGMWG
jgi:hypothetical protein